MIRKGRDNKEASNNSTETDGLLPDPEPICLLSVPEQYDVSTHVPFVKQIVRYFIIQTEVLHGLALRHSLRFVADKQSIANNAIILTLGKANKFALPSLNRISQNRRYYNFFTVILITAAKVDFL